MKFCMITTFYPPYNFGGDGIFIYRLCNSLAAKGHDVDIIHCHDSYLMLEPNGPKGSFSNHPNVTVHGLKSGFGRLSPVLTHQTGYPLLKSRKIESIIARKHFDVIHYHNISLVGGPKLLRPRKAVTLYTMHEYWLSCSMHFLWKYNRENCRERSCIRCCLAWKKIPQLWRYTKMLERAVRHVDCFIAPSRFTLQKHADMGLCRPMKHIPYFLSPLAKQASPANAGSQSKMTEPYFLFVGRLEKNKGLQNIIPVFKNYPAAALRVAGEGAYGCQLRQEASGNSNIRFLGLKSHRDLNTLYQNAIALIVPSIWHEVFGIVVIEAFAMKTPVIAHNVGGPPELIHKSKGGMVYSNRDELIHAMDVLRTQPETRKNLGLNGYNAYQKYWSGDHHLDMYFQLIADIASKKKTDTGR